jgi:hypothetical protein
MIAAMYARKFTEQYGVNDEATILKLEDAGAEIHIREEDR